MSQSSAPKSTRRVAVVGGGISGIGSMWGLAHEDCEVHLFESDSRLGGHANTVMFDGCGISVPVDTGFIAMKEKTYRKQLSKSSSLRSTRPEQREGASFRRIIGRGEFANSCITIQLSSQLSSRP